MNADDATRRALAELEDRWTAALVGGDPAAIRAFMTPEFTMTTAGWLDGPADGDAWLGHVLERFVLETFAFDELVVRTHGDVAIVQCRCRQRGTVVATGEPWAMTMRYTDVWLRDGPTWRIDVRHASGRPD